MDGSTLFLVLKSLCYAKINEKDASIMGVLVEIHFHHTHSALRT